MLFLKTWYNEVLRIQEGSRCVVLSVVVVNQVLLTVGKQKMATQSVVGVSVINVSIALRLMNV